MDVLDRQTELHETGAQTELYCEEFHDALNLRTLFHVGFVNDPMALLNVLISFEFVDFFLCTPRGQPIFP